MAVIERDHYPDNALNKLDTALNDIEKLKRTASTAGITTSDVSALIAAHAADAEAHHATIPDATESVKGIAELATTTEAQTGTATDLIVTPAGLRADVPATPAASRGVRLSAGGHLIMPAAGDVRPFGVSRGVGARQIQGTVVTPDLHFNGADSIPTGYAWQGSPFATPGTQYYNWLSDFYRGAIATNTRGFMSRAVTNSAANWQNKNLYGRFSAGAYGRIGLRLDNGSDDNYAQIFVDGSAGDGTETLKFQYRSGGGSVTTVTSAINIPAETMIALRMLCYYNSGTGAYTAYGYIYSVEIDYPSAIANFSATITAWVPAAGRAGLFVENPTANAMTPGFCDWLYNEFV